jgi:hypothetical protein
VTEIGSILTSEVCSLLVRLHHKAPPDIAEHCRRRIKLHQAMNRYPQSLAPTIERLFRKLPIGHPAIEALAGGGK